MRKFIKRAVAGLLTAIFLTQPVMAATDYRDAGIFSQEKGIYFSGNSKYRSQNEGGFTVYVPYDHNMPGQEIFKYMFVKLFNIYKSGVGSHYASAGARFHAPAGYTNIGGVNTSYFVKSVAANNGNSIPATSDLHDFVSDYNVEFRYSGVMIDVGNTNRGTVVTNPTFPSDFASSSSSGGAARLYNQYKKDQQTVAGQVTMYGGPGADYVIPWEQLKKNYPGGSGIPSNIASASPYYKLAQETFEKWAEITEIGAKYKQAYAQNPGGVEWWNYLKDYLRIDGDYRKGSVLLTAVYNNGSLKYNTYYIPYPVEANTIVSKINVLDENGNLLDYSERPVEFDDACGGADGFYKNQGTSGKAAGQPVTLERGKTYQVEFGLTFASFSKKTSTTEKASAAAAADIRVFSKVKDIAETDPFKSYGSSISSSMQNMNSMERTMLNTNTSGGIQTKTSHTAAYAAGGSESYHLGMAAYKNPAFTVDETFPDNGVIRIAVPEIYDQNGDNCYRNDDYLDLEYTLTGVQPELPNEEIGASYGDMNLGQREYRRLHYKVTEMVDNPDAPILDDEGNETGEYEQMPWDFEYISEYGTWESEGAARNGDKAGDWPGVPEADGDNYPISEDAWWEYDQQWPDQSEDAYYKIWLTKNGDSWSKNNEDYYRSETADYPFTLGFSTSRSRSHDTLPVNPHLIVSVYGISPETDSDGELIETFNVIGRPVTPYTYSENNYIYLTNNYIAERYKTAKSANDDYPFIRVEAQIDKNYHGESGIYGDAAASPYHNGWQDAHDHYERTFEAISDDMELTDVKVKDAEGIVIYHATQSGGRWKTLVKGYFDKEEDMTMDVKLKQTVSSGHNVKNPTIDVEINGESKTGGNVSTYVRRTITNEETLGLDVETTFSDIAFRPKDVDAININIHINDIHDETNWRENVWDGAEDSFYDRIQCTTANLKVSPNVEVYNSKNNQKTYLTFAEKLNFKFDIQHIGDGERQTAIIGNSKINPLPSVDVAIYDADMLTQDESGNVKFDNVRVEDDRATGALIWTGRATAKSRLFPGLGAQNYSTHVQVWIHDYVVQSHNTPSGNKAAYGRLLITGGISNELYLHGLNENTNSVEDYVQQEFIGEHNLYIKDMVVTGQNSISDNSWYYSKLNQSSEDGEYNIENPNGITVSVAVSNMPTAYSDPTVIDRTYLDIYINDEETPRKSVILDVPAGDTVPVSVVIPDLMLEKNMRITAKVNYGHHQTHFEYVLAKTDTNLNMDPFTDNVAVRTVSPNLPDTEHAPNANIINGIPDAAEIIE